MTYDERRIASATTDLETARNLVEVAGNLFESCEGGETIAAMCKAAQKIVDETYMAARKLEHKLMTSPFQTTDANANKE